MDGLAGPSAKRHRGSLPVSRRFHLPARDQLRNHSVFIGAYLLVLKQVIQRYELYLTCEICNLFNQLYNLINGMSCYFASGFS
jgi:hypothetical protein